MITSKMKDVNQVQQSLPPIAQLATNMTEGIIQDIMRTELTEEVTKLLENYNMTGENGFLRVVVARNTVSAYLAIPQNAIKQNTQPENDVRKANKPLFAVAKDDNNNFENELVEDSSHFRKISNEEEGNLTKSE
jgi:hypothetical protein